MKTSHRTWDKAVWAELPDEPQLRVVTFRVEVKGFRTKEVTVTTLLDEQQYPDSAIAELYRQRWSVELSFREIKTTWIGPALKEPSTPCSSGHRCWSRRSSSLGSHARNCFASLPRTYSRSDQIAQNHERAREVQKSINASPDRVTIWLSRLRVI